MKERQADSSNPRLQHWIILEGTESGTDLQEARNEDGAATNGAHLQNETITEAMTLPFRGESTSLCGRGLT
jgi:hypothetical protein